MPVDDNHEAAEKISKSQRKRDMLALQDLGRRLTGLSEGQLHKLALPANLLEAVEAYGRLPNRREAKRRQLQFIGKLMRDVDITAIEAFLEQTNQNQRSDAAKQHKLENLRDELVAGNQESLDRLIREHRDIDVQHLRRLIRQTRKEAEQDQASTAGRKLFRYLRDMLQA